MNKDNERITYEEFMTMFINAPRIAYTLYDKAEDEIDRLNSIINKAIEYNKSLCELYDLGSMERGNADTNLIILGDKEHLEILKELKEEGK